MLYKVLAVSALVGTDAFAAQPVLGAQHLHAARAVPAMTLDAGRRAQLAGAFSAAATGLTALSASAAGPTSTPWAYSTFLDAVEVRTHQT
jgi:hypothetical protein